MAGIGFAARLHPVGVLLDAAGNVFLADSTNGRVRKVDAVTGIIITIAGGGDGSMIDAGDNGPATSAWLYLPGYLAWDGAGSLYISEFAGQRIRRVIFDHATASLLLSTPNGGETWRVGDAQAIRWISSGSIPQVSIELSRDLGSTWEVLTAATSSNGAYTWTVSGLAHSFTPTFDFGALSPPSASQATVCFRLV